MVLGGCGALIVAARLAMRIDPTPPTWFRAARRRSLAIPAWAYVLSLLALLLVGVSLRGHPHWPHPAIVGITVLCALVLLAFLIRGRDIARAYGLVWGAVLASSLLPLDDGPRLGAGAVIAVALVAWLCDDDGEEQPGLESA